MVLFQLAHTENSLVNSLENRSNSSSPIGFGAQTPDATNTTSIDELQKQIELLRKQLEAKKGKCHSLLSPFLFKVFDCKISLL